MQMLVTFLEEAIRGLGVTKGSNWRVGPGFRPAPLMGRFFYDVASLCLVVMFLLGASTASEQQDAIKRLELAVSKTDIFSLPSFRLKANVQVQGDREGNMSDGSYTLLWNGPTQWREELTFPDYNEIQVGGKDGIWIKRSADVVPLRIFQLHETLGFGAAVGPQSPSSSFVRLDLTSKDTVKKTRSRTENGEKQTC